MAQEIKKEETEKERREREKAEREKKDKEELEKRRQEKIRKKKARDKRIKNKEEKERKRIKSIINFPYQTLFRVSALFFFMSFLLLFFWFSLNIEKAMLSSFFIFSLIYIGAGIIMMGIFFLISENKKKEIEEQKKLEEEQRKIEEDRRKEQLEELEKEMKLTEQRRDEELRKFREQKNAELPQPQIPTINNMEDEMMESEMQSFNQNLEE